MKNERVLVFLKPDAVVRRYVGARVIRELLTSKTLRINHFGEASPPEQFFADAHYGVHKGKFFYSWLIRYVTSSPILVFILEGEAAVAEVRNLLGATISEDAGWDTLRGRYGILGGINVAHASDSVENGEREVGLWEPMIKRRNVSCVKEAMDYSNQYIDFPTVDVLRYRELSESLRMQEMRQDRALRMFEKLLLQETDMKQQTVSQLSEVMVANVLLRDE